jgi:hypothetical protein
MPPGLLGPERSSSLPSQPPLEMDHMDAQTTRNDKPTWRELQDAAYAALNCKAATNEARKLTDNLCDQITTAEQQAGKRQKKRGLKKAEQLRTAVEALVADLLRAQASGKVWVYRPKRPESFTGEPVTHRTFITMTEMLCSIGLLGTKPGFQDPIQWEPGGPKLSNWRFATRFRATQALLDLCADHGVRPDAVDRHFLLPLPEHPLQRRRASKRDDFGKKIRGKPMRFEHTPKSEWLEGRIRELNEFLDGKLGGGVHRGYVCVFNNGDNPHFDWDKGGRLYSQGHQNYQQMPDTERLKLTIECEPVCEIDVKASYLTIFHALHRERFDLDKDPYALHGLGESAKDVVKSWCVATFGHDRHLNRWPQKMCEDYRKETGKALGKVYPIKKLRQRMIEAHPVLACWGEPLNGNKLGWAELMYVESSAIQAAMFALKSEGIASFCVHDSLIVPRHAVSFAIQCLADAYHEEAGTEDIALVVSSTDEPDQRVIGRREVKDWELEDERPESGHSLTEPEHEADDECFFLDRDSEALHGAAGTGDEDDPFSPKEDDDYDPSHYGEDDDEDGNAGTASWSDPEAAYRAPSIEWLKRDMLPPGRSHYGNDDDDEDRG